MKKRWICWVLLSALVLGMIPALSLDVRADAAMKASGAVIDMIKTMEGFSATPYWDNSHYTIGYGTTCPNDKVNYYKENPMTKEEAQKELETFVSRFENAINQFADKYCLSFTQNEFDALLSFTYNCGSAWMSSTNGFFNTAVREGVTGGDFVYAICLYSGAGGGYYKPNRRMTEANMYLNGVYKAHNSGTNTYPETYKWVYLDGNGGEVNYNIYGFDAAEKKPVSACFTDIPTGKDKDGKPFVYTLEGWYTADGKKVEVLDSSVEKGAVLYARWKDPEGTVVTIPKGETTNVEVTVESETANVRTGPGTYYPQVDKVKENDKLQLTQVYETGNYTWGKTDKGWLRLDATNYGEVYAEQQTFPKKGITNESGVNCRTGPGTSNPSTGKLKKGESVVITEVEYTDQWWGKTDKGYWVAMEYVTYNEDIEPTVEKITLLALPAKLNYVQKSESLMPQGSVLQITYTDGTIRAMSLDRTMTSFSADKLGTTTATVTYRDAKTTFEVNIIKATVTFLRWDGEVLSQEQYAYGQEVTIPKVESQEVDGKYYVFAGWDKEIITVAGNAVYTAKAKKSSSPDGGEILPSTITSNNYTVDKGFITGVPAGTTVNILISGVNEKDYTVVYNGKTKLGGDALIGTGMTVKLEKAAAEYSLTAVVTGDVNGDGDITITDMLTLKAKLLNKSDLTGVYAMAADLNGDGGVSITDFIQTKAILLDE